jgi:hypothetical protein
MTTTTPFTFPFGEALPSSRRFSMDSKMLSQSGLWKERWKERWKEGRKEGRKEDKE